MEDSEPKPTRVPIQLVETQVLDESGAVIRGPIMEEFPEAWVSMMTKSKVKYNAIRGGMDCPICQYNDVRSYFYIEDRIVTDGDDGFIEHQRWVLQSNASSNAFLWIPTQSGIVYSTTAMLFHLIVDHGYGPPMDLQEAVVFFAENWRRFEWNATRAWNQQHGLSEGEPVVEFQ